MKQRGQGVVHIKDLFSKYTSVLKAPQKVVIEHFIHIVFEVLGYTLKKEQCRYNPTTHTINLTVSGVLKTEIIFKKQELLTKLNSLLSKKDAIQDLR